MNTRGGIFATAGYGGGLFNLNTAFGESPDGLGNADGASAVGLGAEVEEAVRLGQHAMNEQLLKMGCRSIAADGKLGPETCGAFYYLKARAPSGFYWDIREGACDGIGRSYQCQYQGPGQEVVPTQPEEPEVIAQPVKPEPYVPEPPVCECAEDELPTFEYGKCVCVKKSQGVSTMNMVGWGLAAVGVGALAYAIYKRQKKGG